MTESGGIEFKGRRLSLDEARTQILAQIAGRQSQELRQSLSELGVPALQTMAKKIEAAEKPLTPEELLRDANSLGEHQTVADRVIAGVQVVLRGVSKGLPRISVGKSMVVNPEQLIEKIPLVDASKTVTGAPHDDVVTADVRRHQKYLKDLERSFRTKGSLDYIIEADQDSQIALDVAHDMGLQIAPKMLEILTGTLPVNKPWSVEVTKEQAEAIESGKPTYKPLFTIKPSEKPGRFRVECMGAIEAVSFYGINAAWAVKRVGETMEIIYDKMGKPDNRGLVHAATLELLTRQLPKEAGLIDVNKWVDSLRRGSIVASKMMPLTMGVMLVENGVNGMAFELGGKGSHIYSVAEGTPTVLGIHGLITHGSIGTNNTVVIDDELGLVVVNPTIETLRYYRRKKEYFNELEKRMQKYMQEPVARTKDGVEVRLSANVEFDQHVEDANKFNIRDIGLLRSEAKLLEILGRNKDKNLDQLAPIIEQEMFRFYKGVIDQFKGTSMSIRDMDVAGRDKVTHDVQRLYPDVDLSKDFVGGLDFILHAEKLHKAVLRAILKAVEHGVERGKKVRLLVPMVCNTEQLRKYKARVDETIGELSAGGVKVVKPDIVVMFENLDGIRLRESIMAEVTGGSIGTNDLIHFMTGKPRDQEGFQIVHPSVIETVEQVTQTAERQGKKVSICGEMAYDPIGAGIAVLAGVRILSGTSAMAPHIKQLLSHLDTKEHAYLLAESKKCETYEQLRALWERGFPVIKGTKFEEKPPFEMPPEVKE